jgi:hypothetical protein
VSGPLRFDLPLRPGDAELGNRNAGAYDNNTRLRHLNGCTDELLPFAPALPAEEFGRLSTQSRPPS